MNDAKKTKAQLLEELVALRQQNAAWEAVETQGQQPPIQRILSSSPAVIYIFGYDAPAYLEDTTWWSNHLHPDGREALLTEGKSALFEHDTYVCEYRFQHQDGTYRGVRDELKLVRSEDGEPVEIIGSWVDITDRKRAEDTRRESEERLQRVFTTRAEGGVLISLDGQIIYANPAADGRAALRAAEVQPPDLILLDINMGKFQSLGRAQRPSHPARTAEG